MPPPGQIQGSVPSLVTRCTQVAALFLNTSSPSQRSFSLWFPSFLSDCPSLVSVLFLLFSVDPFCGELRALVHLGLLPLVCTHFLGNIIYLLDLNTLYHQCSLLFLIPNISSNIHTCNFPAAFLMSAFKCLIAI